MRYKEREWVYFLKSIKGVGNNTIHSLFENLEDINDIYNYNSEEISFITNVKKDIVDIIKKNISNIEQYTEQLYKLYKDGINYITCYDEDFPDKLKYISDAPVALFYKGSLPSDNPVVSVVGTRSPSTYGISVTQYIVNELNKNKIEIISGMACGIDAISHNVSIKNCVKTYAVLGSGINVCYPKSNISIYNTLANEDNGGIISEYNVFEQPKSYNFPFRNRIISALSDLVIVVEARKQSGTLITASYAAEQGKEVYVVPGRFKDKLSEGCNRLIADGASIINDVSDILYSLNCNKKYTCTTMIKPKLNKKLQMVYDNIDVQDKYIENIINDTKLEYSELISCLVELECLGYIYQRTGNYYTKCL